MMLGHDKQHGAVNYSGICGCSSVPGELHHLPGRGRTRHWPPPLRGGASHAAGLSLNQSLSPCASESRLLQHLFLAARQGRGPAWHPRGHELKPRFVPVPGNALCTEQSNCHGEEHPSGQRRGGLGGLRPTLITYPPAVTRTFAIRERHLECTPSFGKWKLGK